MDLPAETQLRWILRNTAALLELGAEPVSGLVLPTGDFFPDHFDGSPGSLVALMQRVQRLAGLGDLRVELRVVTPEGEEQTVSCSSGACGGTGKIEARIDRVAHNDDGSYTVTVGAGEVRSPTVLTTALIRSVAFMFLTEVGGYEGVLPSDREPLTDLAGTLLGFGVLLANGSYMYMKGCGGVKVHSATRMPVDEITVALALFCKLHDVPERQASRSLELTPSEHFAEAMVWSHSNASLVKLLRDKPAKIAADEYSIAPARSWLARVLGVGSGKKKAETPEDELAALEQDLSAKAALGPKKAPVDPAKARKMAELKALVDESLTR
ncbi:MAG: hypothetical protein U0359_16325 [Byssovorax sp.]